MFTLTLLKVTGSRATTITPYHSENRDTKMTKFTWSVLKVVLGYLNISKPCLLCLNEKFLTGTSPDQKQLLNKRS